MNNRQFIIEDIESFLHMSKDDVYKVLSISITPDFMLLVRIAEGKKGGDRKQVVISLSTEELLKLAKICEIVAEKQIENKLNGALDRMR